MKRASQVAIIGIGLLLAACSSGAQQPKGNAPVETKDPNAKYKPAFAGQTGIQSVKTTTAYDHQVITNKLMLPWGIAALPDGRFLVTEREGKLRIVTAAGAISDPIAGVPKVNSGGQGGLLGICLDNAFQTSRMIYFAFSEPVAGGNVTSVAKAKLSTDEKSLEGVTVIYRALPAYKGTMHYGGRVVMTKDGHLFLSTGERSDMETRPQAQDLNSGLGKVIRITTDGQPAAGNPFAGKAGARAELYSFGHRNVQGLAIHPATGDLWETEFGPRGGDELNLIKAGNNYGWPVITYGIEYSGKTIGDVIQQKEGMEQPIYYWDPVISPSGITFYNGTAIPEWQNNLFISCLSGMHICRLVINNNRVVGEERLLAEENQRFRDITQGTDGALYAVTDQGRLYRIGKK